MHPRPLNYGDRPKVSRAKFARPTRASSAVSAPAERSPAETAPPTDFIGITAGSKLYPELSEGQVRLWVNRGQLPSYHNPVPGAGRRPGRGRSIQRWISASELAAFVAARKKGASDERPLP